MNKIICKHYGDMGDVIFSLPALRYYKDKENFVDLELDLNGGKGKMQPYKALPQRGYTKFNQKAYNFLHPLLAKQDYIDLIRDHVTEIIQPGVEYVDLNLFRNAIGYNNITYSTLVALEIIKSQEDVKLLPKLTERWLEVGENNEEKYNIIVNRTLRSQGNHAFWESFLPEQIKQGRKIGFIGTELEHKVLCEVMEVEIPRVEVSDALQMARLIDKCDLFVSNEGLPGAIAIGLNKRLICEVNKTYPATVYPDKKELFQYV